MIHSGLALQSSLFVLLNENGPLIDRLGSTAIYDHVPTEAAPPYITFGEATYFDWGTGTEAGTEHAITLNVWSAHDGRKEVLQIAGLVEQAMQSAPHELDGHVLVNLTHESTEVSRDVEADLFLARINLRAVTEPN
ncbi:MAG: DUF3168 domain-containing protein [Pseudomonadota bacterium]